jgi:hypothetical protein
MYAILPDISEALFQDHSSPFAGSFIPKLAEPGVFEDILSTNPFLGVDIEHLADEVLPLLSDIFPNLIAEVVVAGFDSFDDLAVVAPVERGLSR